MTRGTKTTLDLARGDTLPAWREPSCTTRWEGLTIPNGAAVTVIGEAPHLGNENGAEWVIVNYLVPGEDRTIFAPAEIHDHLGIQ